MKVDSPIIDGAIATFEAEERHRKELVGQLSYNHQINDFRKNKIPALLLIL